MLSAMIARRLRRCTSVLVAAIVCHGGAAHAAPILAPISSSVGLHAMAAVVPGTVVNLTDSDSQLTAVGPLDAAVSGTALGDAGSVAIHGAVAANWVTADAGRFTFTDLGWDAIPGSGSSDGVFTGGAAFDGAGAFASYTFMALEDAELVVEFSTTPAGSTHLFGLNGFTLWLNGTLIGVAGINVISDSVSQGLAAGQHYELVIRNQSNIGGAMRAQSTSLDGTFSFTAVPEPSSMVLLGSAAAAFIERSHRARRRSRRA